MALFVRVFVEVTRREDKNERFCDSLRRVVDVYPTNEKREKKEKEIRESEKRSNYRGKGWTKLVDGTEREGEGEGERERGGSPNLDKPVACRRSEAG